MLKTARITSVTGDYVDVNDLNYPLHEMTTEVDIRFPEREKSQQHGIWNGNQYLGKRLWHWTGAILADTSGEYVQKRTKLIKVVMPHAHLHQKICGTLSLEWEGINDILTQDFILDTYPEIPIQGLGPAISEFIINLKCPDPRLYGQERTVETIAPPISVIGRNYDKTFDYTYPGGTTQPADILVDNAGNLETYPRFRIIGYVENPRLTLIRYDGSLQQVALEGLTVQTTDFVDVDFKNRTAVLNNTLNVYSYTTAISEWWALEPTVAGVLNTVRYSGTNIQPGSKATIWWKPAYML
jgi:hypothetical protein